MLPDFKKLGPKYSREMKDVSLLLSKADFDDVITLKQSKNLQLGSYSFGPDEIVFTPVEELQYSRYVKLRRILGV